MRDWQEWTATRGAELLLVYKLLVGGGHRGSLAPALVGGRELTIGGDDAGILTDLEALLWSKSEDGLANGLMGPGMQLRRGRRFGFLRGLCHSDRPF